MVNSDTVVDPRAKIALAEKEALAAPPIAPVVPVAEEVIEEPVTFVDEVPTRNPSQVPLIQPAIPVAPVAPQVGDYGAGLQKQGFKQEADAISGQAKEEVAYRSKLGEKLADREIDALEMKEKAEADKERATQEFDNASKEVAGIKFEEPNFWANRSTGNKVLLGLAMAIGSLGKDGGESVRQTIKNWTDQDLAMQKQKYETAKGKESTAYSRLRDAGMSDKEARLAYDMAIEKKTENYFLERAANAKSETAKAKYLQLAGSVNQMQQEKKEAYQLNYDTKQAAILKAQAEAKNASSEANQGKTSYGDWDVDFGKNKEAQAKFQEKAVTAKTFKDYQQKILKDVKNMNRFDPNSKERIRIQTDLKTLVGDFKKMIGDTGALTKEEREFMQEAMGDPTQWTFQERELEKLNSVVQRAYKSADEYASFYGGSKKSDQAKQKYGFKGNN